jgi:Protein of unknown function (DUF1524)
MIGISSEDHYGAVNPSQFRQQINVGIGNDRFKEKKKVYAKSPFGLARRIAKFEKWGPDEIEIFQAELADDAPKVWPI